MIFLLGEWGAPGAWGCSIEGGRSLIRGGAAYPCCLYCINNAATRGENPSSETPPLFRSIMPIHLVD